MSRTDAPGYTPEWLALREGADTAARAPELLDPLRHHLAALPHSGGSADAADAPPGDAGLVIHDLGCGTGSMGRWLAPRLNGPQHWILHDHDHGLLDRAAAQMPRTAADGSHVTVTTQRGDITRLTADDLCGTSLVTASALLDLLTRDELEGLAAACAEAGCPALLALSVVGRVDLTPADPLDAEIADAFNAHQRRVVHDRRLLGPDAVAAASVAFARRGLTVRVHPSPWRLAPVPRIFAEAERLAQPLAAPAQPPVYVPSLDGAGPSPRGPVLPKTAGATRRALRDDPHDSGGQKPDADEHKLTAQWLRGWVGAAREQQPDLAPYADAYLRRRLAACEAGELRVVVHHSDLLALPRPRGGTS